MFGVTEGAMFFTIMLHLGTLVAVVIVYWEMLVELIRHPFQKTVGMLILATVPTLVIAFLFKKVEPFASFYTATESGSFLGYGFLITSALLFASELLRSRSKTGRKMKEMRVTDALLIGTMQGVAILPSVSPLRRHHRGRAVLRPQPQGCSGFFVSDVDSGDHRRRADRGAGGAGRRGIGDIHWTTVVAGMLVAGITGYFAVKVMIAAIKKKKLLGFVIYTALLGALVLVDQFVTHYFF